MNTSGIFNKIVSVIAVHLHGIFIPFYRESSLLAFWAVEEPWCSFTALIFYKNRSETVESIYHEYT